MKFCQSLMYAPAGQFVALTKAAEDAGFDQVSLSDHVFYPAELRSAYPYRADGAPQFPPDTEWPDVWVTMGALAAATTTITFSTHVYVLPARNPFVVAKAVGTAAFLSGGRARLGIGAGWMEEEFEQLGQPFAGRGGRMEEMVAVLRTLWQGGMVEHHGEHYDFGPLQMAPVPVEPVPIYVGGHSEVALRRAAAIGDGWMGIDYAMEDLVRHVRRIDELRKEAGRDHLPFEHVAAVQDLPRPEVVEELEAVGLGTLITSAWLIAGGDTSSLEQNLDALGRFGETYLPPLRS
ncbi:hypothetical protein BH24ACT3_BH24ACT3_02310 [soil metagenome]